MQKTILHNQSLLDFSLQRSGTVESLFQIAIENGISVTDDLEAGSDLMVPQVLTTDTDVLGYYDAKGIQPATSISTQESELIKRLGIGSMAVGSTFIVG